MKNTLLKVALATTLFTSAAVATKAQTMYGLTTSNEIFTMTNISSPGNVNGPYSISGVTTGQMLVALDSRPDNGGLYALGYDSTSGMAQLYRITGSGSSYSASAVNSSATVLNLGTGRSVGFDFISTLSNQIRITGTNGSNYVMNADNGSVMNTGSNNISYASGDLNVLANAAIGATSYTNSYYGSDATDQYGFDVNLGALVRFDGMNYYNNGNNSNYNYPSTIHTVGITSGLLLTGNHSVGMDSWYDTASHSNSIWLSATALLNGSSHLYRMDNNTGLAQDMGAIGTGNFDVRDIAFGIDRDSSMSNTAVQGQLMAALTLNLRNLIFFDSYRPNMIRHMAHLNGMASGQAMLAVAYGFDQRLYGLGYNGSNQTYQLYTIDSASGNVTAVNNSPYSMNLGNDTSAYNNGSSINVAFNFVGDFTNRIRVIGNHGMTNVLLDATSGAVVETDSSVSYGSTDANAGVMVDLGSIGYTNAYNGSDSSQMFGYDFNTGAMVSLGFTYANNNSGNGNGSNFWGSLSTTLSLNTILNIFGGNNNNYRNGYMDIVWDAATQANLGFMASNYYGTSTNTDNYSNFYTMSNAGTSSATMPASNGSIGSGTPVKTMAAQKTARTTAVANVASTNLNGLFAYPNPAISATRIVLPAAATSKVFVDVIDMNGRVVRSYEFALGSYQLDLDMSNIPTGLYSVRVMQNGGAPQAIQIMKN